MAFILEGKLHLLQIYFKKQSLIVVGQLRYKHNVLLITNLSNEITFSKLYRTKTKTLNYYFIVSISIDLSTYKFSAEPAAIKHLKVISETVPVLLD